MTKEFTVYDLADPNSSLDDMDKFCKSKLELFYKLKYSAEFTVSNWTKAHNILDEVYEYLSYNCSIGLNVLMLGSSFPNSIISFLCLGEIKNFYPFVEMAMSDYYSLERFNASKHLIDAYNSRVTKINTTLDEIMAFRDWSIDDLMNIKNFAQWISDNITELKPYKSYLLENHFGYKPRNIK